KRYTLHVTRYTLHVTRYTLHVTASWNVQRLSCNAFPVPIPPPRPRHKQPPEDDAPDREREARRRWRTEEGARVRQQEHRDQRPESVAPGAVARPRCPRVEPHARDEHDRFDDHRADDGVPQTE